jgi:RNA polymerase sigma factor (sigma-70 family)
VDNTLTQRETAFIRIIQEHDGLIRKVARVYAKTAEDIRDLYQDIVYQLWKSFPSFKNESKISTWMYRVALNTSFNHLNREKANRDHIPLDELPIDQSDTTDTLMDDRSEILFGLIKKLNDIEKGIILLYLEGKSYDEIAAITGFSASNVGTRMGRIRQKMISQIS